MSQAAGRRLLCGRSVSHSFFVICTFTPQLLSFFILPLSNMPLTFPSITQPSSSFKLFIFLWNFWKLYCFSLPRAICVNYTFARLPLFACFRSQTFVNLLILSNNAYLGNFTIFFGSWHSPLPFVHILNIILGPETTTNDIFAPKFLKMLLLWILGITISMSQWKRRKSCKN